MLLWFSLHLCCQMQVESEPVVKRVNKNHVSLLKQDVQIHVHTKLSALPFLHPVPPLCLGLPAAPPKPKTPCSGILNKYAELIYRNDSEWNEPLAIFLPGDTLSTSFSEGWTLLFDHTHQRRHHTSLQQLRQPLPHIGRRILTHNRFTLNILHAEKKPHM